MICLEPIRGGPGEFFCGYALCLWGYLWHDRPAWLRGSQRCWALLSTAHY